MKSKLLNQKRMVVIKFLISEWPIIKRLMKLPDHFPPMDVIVGELTDENVTAIQNAIPAAVIITGSYVASKIAVSKQHKKQVMRQFEDAVKASDGDPLSEEKKARLLMLVREIDSWED